MSLGSHRRQFSSHPHSSPLSHKSSLTLTHTPTRTLSLTHALSHTWHLLYFKPNLHTHTRTLSRTLALTHTWHLLYFKPKLSLSSTISYAHHSPSLSSSHSRLYSYNFTLLQFYNLSYSYILTYPNRLTKHKHFFSLTVSIKHLLYLYSPIHSPTNTNYFALFRNHTLTLYCSITCSYTH